MTRIDGTYEKTWSNAAAANLVRQVPLIAASFPSIAAYHPATLNVRFGPMVIVAGSDCRTPPLKWKPGGEDGETGEAFDLVRCRLAIGVRESVGALMYVGHWSLHRLDPHKQEFLADRYIDGLQDGLPVTVEIDRPTIELPYSKQQRGGHGIVHAHTIVVL